MAKSDPIDFTSDQTVLEYVEGTSGPSGVPQRDLHGGDLGYLALVALLTAADQDAPDFVRPEPTPADAAAVVKDLIASGAFRVPSKTIAAPAAEPEA